MDGGGHGGARQGTAGQYLRHAATHLRPVSWGSEDNEDYGDLIIYTGHENTHRADRSTSEAEELAARFEEVAPLLEELQIEQLWEAASEQDSVNS